MEMRNWINFVTSGKLSSNNRQKKLGSGWTKESSAASKLNGVVVANLRRNSGKGSASGGIVDTSVVIIAAISAQRCR